MLNPLSRDSELTSPPQRGESVLITGSSGLVGTELTKILESQGYRVVKAVRRPPRSSGELEWQPLIPFEQIPVDQRAAFEGFDAVIHLAGENIAGGRWNKNRKERIRNSRIESTQNLCQLLNSLESPPRIFLSASAIGGYSQTTDKAQTEEDPFVDGFLGEVCSGWEQSSEILEEKGIRRVLLRIGLVLSPHGGLLQKLVPIFKCFLGGKISHGQQWMSWVDLDDLIQIILFSLQNQKIKGPINCTAPGAVRNEDFTTILAAKLRRPVAPRVPALALKVLYGEMGQALIINGARVLPTKLEAAGYRFRHPDLPSCLRNQLT
ncbi:MAG: TIGR01777 family protein [Planctomycetia bacterium]|nr:TIGR01777 family protein [Planctomycetia bacterium]MBL6914571.1 TIGR01777 family protein [Planctomycetota bacterium]